VSGARDGVAGRVTHDRQVLAAQRARESFMQEMVPVGRLREAFEASDVSASELARRLGWFKPDSGRVRRALFGLPSRPGGFVRAETAGALAEALGLDPVDVGL
jgi:hypothetical protein